MNKESLFEKIKGTNVHKLPPGEEKDRLQEMERKITSAVAAWKQSFNPRVKLIGEALWDIIGKGVVPVIYGVPVPSLTFAAMANGGTDEGAILVPQHWDKMIDRNALMQMGALMYVGSQAVDFFNGHVKRDDNKDVLTRAEVYEAEFILTVTRGGWPFEFDDYHKQLLSKFPKGFDTPSVAGLYYEPRAFKAAEA